MLEVAGRNRDKVGDSQRQYTSARTVDGQHQRNWGVGEYLEMAAGGELGHVRP